MSPILLRPFREQFEHDRVIRLLQARLRRRFDVATNAGDARTAAVRHGSNVLFPDLVLSSPQRSRRLQGVVEVETGESVTNLEAMAQWARFAQVRGAAFYLYVPAGSADIARRLCDDHAIAVAEIWIYHAVGDQVRFTMVYKAPLGAVPRRRATASRKRSVATANRKTAGRSRATRARARAAGARSARTQRRK